jgi:hypothetical protein
MPADLKNVAREIVDEVLNHWDELRGFDKLERRLQTLVSEVRARALEECAGICEDFDVAEYNKTAHMIAAAIRRRASGKD